MVDVNSDNHQRKTMKDSNGSTIKSGDKIEQPESGQPPFEIFIEGGQCLLLPENHPLTQEDLSDNGWVKTK